MSVCVWGGEGGRWRKKGEEAGREGGRGRDIIMVHMKAYWLNEIVIHVHFTNPNHEHPQALVPDFRISEVTLYIHLLHLPCTDHTT